MKQTWVRSLALTAIAGVGLAIGQGIPSRAADQATTSNQSSSQVSFPAALQNLPTEPIGLGVFGSQVVFPQFMLDGASSSIAVYDTTTGAVTKDRAPQGQFAYAVAADTKAGVLWIGTQRDLLAFDVATHSIRVTSLPTVAYPYVAPWEHAPIKDWRPTNVLGLTIGPGGSVWITRDHDSGITQFDPASGGFTQYPLPNGIVPRAITLLGQDLVAVNVDHTGNPRYEVNGGNLHTGYLIVDVRSGRAQFTAHPTASLIGTGSGQLVTLATTQQLERVDPGTGNRSSLGLVGSPTMNPGLGRSDRDGSVWIAAGAEIDHVTSNGVVQYAIPIWTTACCPMLPPPPPGGSVPPRPSGTISLYPDASAVGVGSNGDVWFVAAGYNSIGHVSP